MSMLLFFYCVSLQECWVDACSIDVHCSVVVYEFFCGWRVLHGSDSQQGCSHNIIYSCFTPRLSGLSSCSALVLMRFKKRKKREIPSSQWGEPELFLILYCPWWSCVTRESGFMETYISIMALWRSTYHSLFAPSTLTDLNIKTCIGFITLFKQSFSFC